ncbi:MAG TPA: sulfate ABC transporter permease subunit CysT [Candidatus Gastranaerophilales bacterium]|nr:sulfate ABC transporter permease subunit CysT [Candidatus Gastranaerophilales bacterium]
MNLKFKKYSVLPGFGLTLGYTLFYLGFIVLLPLAALIIRGSELGWSGFWQVISDPRVLASYKLTFGTALAAAIINTFFGLIVAWFLTRTHFPGKRFIDSIVDLPFALPTAVSGIALTAVYAPTGWIGKPLMDAGIKVAFTPIGITIAMIFIGLPFVVRTVQPALEELELELEEVAISLGASQWTTLVKVILPMILPSLITGFALSFARAIGEYGSVVFIAGNMPMRTEISSLLIITKLEQYDFLGATAIALGMLIMSFLLLFVVNLLQSWSSSRLKGV